MQAWPLGIKMQIRTITEDRQSWVQLWANSQSAALTNSYRKQLKIRNREFTSRPIKASLQTRWVLRKMPLTTSRLSLAKWLAFLVLWDGALSASILWLSIKLSLMTCECPSGLLTGFISKSLTITLLHSSAVMTTTELLSLTKSWASITKCTTLSICRRREQHSSILIIEGKLRLQCQTGNLALAKSTRWILNCRPKDQHQW